ncbi:hypothetical protein QRE63_30620 (plasmid) [Bacillus mycoides]|uniref:hypothetical protein n=1 Tax=Bacillus cereus group TaxID=86661 RepID=UPI0018F6DC8C|nr:MULTISPECIES: hypothetical protein [Bacillus cereus group]MBJ8056142.1 hypothetical protein [Bacillus cereus]WJE67342.1 hypothetical protein QRE63_30620 [Bacillus mycoides]
MKRGLLIFLTLFLAACSNDAASTKETENTGAAVDDSYLNTPEGNELVELGREADKLAQEQEEWGFYRTGSVVRGKFKSSANSIGSKRCEGFNGDLGQYMRVKKGENWMFSFDETTKEGKIIASVIDSRGNTVLTFDNGKNEMSMKIGEDDLYEVKVSAEDYSGNFLLSYKG